MAGLAMLRLSAAQRHSASTPARVYLWHQINDGFVGARGDTKLTVASAAALKADRKSGCA